MPSLLHSRCACRSAGASRAVLFAFAFAALLFSSGCDVLSGEEDTTPPPPPSNLTATSSSGTVALQWVSSAGDDVAGYNVYRSVDGSAGPGNGAPVNGSLVADTTFADTGLDNGTVYTYRVTAVDDSDNESTGSGTFAIAPFGDPPARP